VCVCVVLFKSAIVIVNLENVNMYGFNFFSRLFKFYVKWVYLSALNQSWTRKHS
jgi:hypothetical protein